MATEILVRDIVRAVRRMRAAWALAQSLLLLDPSTGEVTERGGPGARADR